MSTRGKNKFYSYGTDSTNTLGDLNVADFDGHPIDLGTGDVAEGTLRTVNATDDPNLAAIRASTASSASSLGKIDNWDESNRCKVNIKFNSGTSIAIGTGNVDTGTQRITIATNDANLSQIRISSGTTATNTTGILADTNNIATYTSNLTNWNDGNRCKVNSYINNGVTYDIGSGVIGLGTIRVAIATNDVNLAAINTNITNISSYTANLNNWNEGSRCKINAYLNAGTAFDIGKNNASTGTIRVTIANDDTNLSTINTSTSNTSTYTANLSNWNEGNRCKINAYLNAGTAFDIGKNNASTGTIRVAIANDDTNLAIISAAYGTDGSAVPTRTVQIGGTDGTNLQTVKVDSNGQIYVLQGALAPGEDAANDWRKIKKESTASYTPASTAGTTVSGTTEGTANTILSSVEVIGYPNFTIFVKNNSATALTNCYVYGSPDGSNFVNLSSMKSTIETACETLSNATGIAFIASNQSLRYIKVTATVAAGSTTCDCWITANCN